MIFFLRRTLSWVLLTGCFVGAAGLTPASAEDEPIGLTEWREITRGQTVYYQIEGQLHGREYYWPGSDHVTFQHSSGACADARWSYDSGVYCFHFDRPHCFRHVRRDSRIVIVPVEPDEDGTLTEQTVVRIVSTPFTCEPGATS